ncbi:MAG TPA: TolC family protein [Humidesulfovibrio sp.]|uniref:TolC family protein n=1 Tax=Humidesulfovibrio sp. TaxID=2910988 RepID=UPI002B64B3EE|nr:TolC family protein [Humidesulfovibrio sp.]HWR03699.1 TolC family protein [Humidesulfovibrio sp.]
MTRKKALRMVPAMALVLCLSAPALAQTQAPAAAPAPVAGMTAQQGKAQAMPSSFDLRQAVEYGLANNPTMVSARAQLLGSEYDVNTAMANFLPAATASYGVLSYDKQPKSGGYNTSDQTLWSAQLNLHQPVFTGFQLLSTYQRAKLAKEQNEAKLTQTELALIGAIQTNYLAHLKSKLDVKSAQDSVERMASQLKVTTAFFEVGLKPRLDVLQAEVDAATAEQALLTAKNAHDTTRAKLNSLLNLPLEAPVTYMGELSYLPFSMALAECLDRAYKARPDIQIGVKSVGMAEKDQTIAGSAFYPQVSADYNYYKKGDSPSVNESKYLSNSAKEYWTVGANASWTFFQWGSTYNKYKSGGENVNKMRADLENTKLNAGFEVKQYLLNQRVAADSIAVAHKSVDAARESYRMALARYQAQVGTNTDLLTAQAAVSNSEASLSQALSDYQTALSNLYIAMGEKNPPLEIR